MPHRHHIYAKASGMSEAKMCAYPQSYHASPHWKCVWKCCYKFPTNNLTDQEIDDQYYNIIPSILFHIYHLIARFTTHGRLPLNYKVFLQM